MSEKKSVGCSKNLTFNMVIIFFIFLFSSKFTLHVFIHYIYVALIYFLSNILKGLITLMVPIFVMCVRFGPHIFFVQSYPKELM